MIHTSIELIGSNKTSLDKLYMIEKNGKDDFGFKFKNI